MPENHSFLVLILAPNTFVLSFFLKASPAKIEQNQVEELVQQLMALDDEIIAIEGERLA